jgi:multiple sugar transport system permease protein
MATESLVAASAARPAARRRTAPRTAGRLIARVALYVVLVVAAIAMVAPFVWMILTSLKSPSEVTRFSWFPAQFHFENYAAALSAAPFLQYFRNSLLLTAGETVLTLLFATAAGYALAKLPMRGKAVLMGYVIALLTVPFQVVIVPLFLVVKQIPLAGGNDLLGQGGNGWLDSWWGLIIPFSAGPLYIFLARQFFVTLPSELAEAARIDGLSEYGIFFRIMMPLVKPALLTIAVFQIEAAWNSFLWPLVATRSQDLRPLQVGLAIFAQDPLNIQWSYLMAGATLATLPMILLFVFVQRGFVQGISNSGLKG